MVARRRRGRTQAVVSAPARRMGKEKARQRRACEDFLLAAKLLVRWGSALTFEFFAQLVGALLQIFLQFLLLLLKHLGVGGRTFVGLQEAVAGGVGERQREGDRGGSKVDRLDLQHLAFLELTDQFGRGLIVRHAAIGEAGKELAADRRLLVDDDSGSVLQLERARQRHAEQLLGLAFRLDQCRGHDRLTGLGAGVLAGEADLLGARVIAFAAEFRPRRIDELWHFGRRRLRLTGRRDRWFLRGRRPWLLGSRGCRGWSCRARRWSRRTRRGRCGVWVAGGPRVAPKSPR